MPTVCFSLSQMSSNRKASCVCKRRISSAVFCSCCCIVLLLQKIRPRMFLQKEKNAEKQHPNTIVSGVQHFAIKREVEPVIVNQSCRSLLSLTPHSHQKKKTSSRMRRKDKTRKESIPGMVVVVALCTTKDSHLFLDRTNCLKKL